MALQPIIVHRLGDERAAGHGSRPSPGQRRLRLTPSPRARVPAGACATLAPAWRPGAERACSPCSTPHARRPGIGPFAVGSLAQAMGVRAHLAPSLRLPTGLGPNFICSSPLAPASERGWPSSLSPLIHLCGTTMPSCLDSPGAAHRHGRPTRQTWSDPACLSRRKVRPRSDVGAIVLGDAHALAPAEGWRCWTGWWREGWISPMIMLRRRPESEMCRRAFQARGCGIP